MWVGAFSQPVHAQYTVNGSQTYQTINGFGANINHRSWNNDELKPVLNQMITQGGFTVFRVAIDNSDWMPTNNTSAASFYSIYTSARFEKLWDLIGYLNQQGISNGIMLNFEGPGAQWMGGSTLTSGLESQWALMTSSLISYGRNTRHLQFYLVGPDNEPDNASDLTGVGCSDIQYVTMLTDLIQDLNSNGITDVRLVGPDLASTSTTWMTEMMSSSLLMSNLAHFGLHSYSGDGTGSTGVLSFITSSSYPSSTFWMTEFNYSCVNCYEGVLNTNNYSWSSSIQTAEYLVGHLLNGASGGTAWEGYDSYYEYLPLASVPTGQQASGWSFYGLFGVNSTNGAPKTYTARKSFYAEAQIAAFVPPGSQRIGVSGSQGSFTMLGFYHSPSGRVTLTGYNTGNATSPTITLENLPAVASFALYYTDQNNNLNQSANYPVSGSSFTPTIPADCVFTLTGFDPAKIAVSVQLTNPASGTQYTAPASIPLEAAASTTTGSISNVEFFNGATLIGSNTAAPYDFTWDNVAPGTYTITAFAIDSLGHTNSSAPVTVIVAGEAAQVWVTLSNSPMILPSNATVVPYGQQAFAATVVDELGTPVSPQPGVSWGASGGGLVGFNGVFTASDDTGGPFAVIANSGDLSGSMGINVASNVNLAPYGIGYVWYNLPNSAGNSPQLEAPGINDGNISSNVSLLGYYDGSTDTTDAYEGAGVVWTIPQTISNVVFINGTTSGGNGTFAANFQLQFTQDGVNWTQADSAWTLNSSYPYNGTLNSPVQYMFSGSLATVLGVRCVGEVNTSHNSGYVNATEVEAAFGAPPMLQASPGTNGVIVSWPGPVTNCVLQMTTNILTPSWTTIAGPRQYNGDQISQTVAPTATQQYFRLYFP